MTIEQILDSELLKRLKGAEEINKNEKKHRHITIEHANGCKYVGEIVDGKADG